MHLLESHHRIALLTEGRLGVFTSKTAASLLRYRADDVAAVIDSQAAGQRIGSYIPWARPIPIVADAAAAAGLGCDAVYIGIAPVGGELPEELRRHVLAALRAGLDVVSGLHTRLAADAELVALAAARGARLFDLREPPSHQVVATRRALRTRARRVLTVGTDCNVGKMVAALELTAAAKRRGRDARFVATGQTGIMIAGRGCAIDAVVSDFAAGAAEELVLADADADVLLIEGQGSIAHPGFSAVTLALLHGTCPDALVLVHHVGRTEYRAAPHFPLPALRELCFAYEQLAAFQHPAQVVAVALNGAECHPAQVAEFAHQVERELGVPAADVLAAGCDRLLDGAPIIAA